MVYRRVLYIIWATFLFVACNSTQKKTVDDDVLASIEGLKVTKEDFSASFKRYYYKTGQSIPVNPVTMKAIFDGEFNTYVLVAYARDKGWYDDSESEYERQLINRRVFTDEYLKHFVQDTVEVTDKDTRELFYRFNTVLKASHLYSHTKKGIDSLYNLLQRGASFKDLAKSDFKNAYLANHGGDVGTFSVDQMDISFENAAYNLNIGQYSKPVRTSQGYSIVKLTGKFTKPIMTEDQYDNQINNLRAFALKRKRELATRKNLQDVIQKININENLVHELWNKIQPQSDKFDRNDYESGTLSIQIGGLAETQFSNLNGFSFTGQDILREAFFTPLKERTEIKEFYQFDNLIKGLAFRTYAIQQYKKSSYTNDPAVSESIDQTFYDYLANRVSEHIYNNIKISEAQLQTEYNQNPQQYVSPLKLNLQRIVVRSEKKGNMIVEELRKGTDFVKLLRKYSIDNEDVMVDGELGYRGIGTFGTMSFKLKNLKAGEIAGPFKYTVGKYYVFKCLGRKEGKHLDFEAAKPLVEKVLRMKLLREHKQTIIRETKVKHNAYEDLKKLNNIKIDI